MMSDFFHGWRRKAGCALLIVATAMFIAWMRSIVVLDEITVPFGQTAIIVRSDGARLCWVRRRPVFPSKRIAWVSEGVSEWRPVYLCEFKGEDSDRVLLWNWGAFSFGSTCNGGYMDVTGDTVHMTFVDFRVVPYWSIVLPVTILSACLILWKPRKRKVSAPTQT